MGSDAIDWNDRLMFDRGGGLCLSLKSNSRCFKSRQVGSQDLNGDNSIKRWVPSFEDDSHSPTTDHTGDLVVSNTTHELRIVAR